MRAAVIRELGATPEVEEWPEPVAGDGATLVETTAVGLNPVDLAITSGKFYEPHPPLPFTAGREGVGIVIASPRFATGTRVYTNKARGSLADQFIADEARTWELADGEDHAAAVALGIAGLAGWVAVEERAKVEPGDRVLVLGATGTVGSVAVQAARILGAHRVVAAGRDPERLQRSLELGADAIVELDADTDLPQAFRDAFPDGGPDVVIDPLWGPPALAAITIAAPNMRMVNLGQAAGAEIALTSAAVRSKRLHIIGHTVFEAPVEVLAEAHNTMLSHVRAGRLKLDIVEYPLERVSEAWDEQRKGPHHKLVVTL